MCPLFTETMAHLFLQRPRLSTLLNTLCQEEDCPLALLNFLSGSANMQKPGSIRGQHRASAASAGTAEGQLRLENAYYLMMCCR